MGESLARGMVLVMSLWDDHDVNMLWLDASYPPSSKGKPGYERGPCSLDSGKPSDVENNDPNAKVQFSNIKFGPIGSTNPDYAEPATVKPTESKAEEVIEIELDFL